MAVSFDWIDDGDHHRLNLTGSGTATIEDCYQYFYTLAGGAETYMTKTGTPGVDAVYTFLLSAHPGELYQQIYVNSGVTLEFQAFDTLVFDWPTTTTTDWCIYVYEGGTLLMQEGSTCDGGAGTYTRTRWGIVGRLVVNGTEANPCTYKRFRDVYCYMTEEDKNQHWDVNHMIFTEEVYNGGGFRFFGSTDTSGYQGLVCPHVFNNVTLLDTNGWLVLYLAVDFSNWTMDNWVMDGLERIEFRPGCQGTFKNSTFKNTDSIAYSRETGNASLNYQRYYTNRSAGDIFWKDKVNNQLLLCFDNCTFDSVDSGEYGIAAYSGSTVLLKNPIFINQTAQIYSQYGIVLIYGGDPVTDLTKNYVWAAGGGILHVRKFDVTVNGSDGLPLENAMVTIRQKQGKEFWECWTDANGQVRRADGDPIYLVEKEETSENNYVSWSSGSGDAIHQVTISHPDYALEVFEVAMTEDKTITKQLSTNTTQTKIYDSTIIDSTVY